MKHIIPSFMVTDIKGLFFYFGEKASYISGWSRTLDVVKDNLDNLELLTLLLLTGLTDIICHQA